MTPTERAEKIVAFVRSIDSSYSNPIGLHDAEIMLPNIMKIISEAEREAENNQKFELYELHHSDGRIEKWSGDFEKRMIAKGFSSARDKAAGIAEGSSGHIFTAQDAGIRMAVKKEIAERIRAMVPGETK